MAHLNSFFLRVLRPFVVNISSSIGRSELNTKTTKEIQVRFLLRAHRSSVVEFASSPVQ